MLSSYFDHRARREERRLAEERRQLDAALAEQRHQEMMALIVALHNGRNRDDDQGQNELIRILQQAVADLQAENARLRQQNGNGNSTT